MVRCSKKSYKVNEIDKQSDWFPDCDIGLYEGTPTVHAHISVGFETGGVEGGHLIEAVTFPTVELMTVFRCSGQRTGSGH